MTRIKICGITNWEDAQWAAACGADALGFVFAASPRQVAPELAREILSRLEPFATAVGVFVDWSVAQVKRALEASGCAVAQLHGEEPPEYLPALAPYAVVKGVRVGETLDRAWLGGYKEARAILLDSYVAGRAGGTGQRFDVGLAARLVEEGWRVIVAGGLSAENVGEVIARARPYGVDVSSGVERAPGQKDHQKVAEFIAAVRAADRAFS